MLVEQIIDNKIEIPNSEYQTFCALDSNHLNDLARSGLQAETINALRIHSVPPNEISNHLGFPAPQISSALCFPYPGVDGFCRDKIFPPITDESGHTIRYLQRKGSGAHLYFTPSAQAILTDPTATLWFVEGEKKAAAGHQAGLATIGFGGVWNWLQAGNPIAELDLIVWKNRHVVLIPDSDVWGRQDLLHAVYALGAELEKRGAFARVLRIPQRGEEKMGLDDCLVNSGLEELLQYEQVPLSSQIFAEARTREERRQEKLTGGNVEVVEDTEEEIPSLPAFPEIAWRGVYKTYYEAVGPTTSAPDAFHFAAFDAAVGCRLGRRVYMYYGQNKRIYPNSDYLLIGPTGDHKGTAGEGVLHLLSPYPEDIAVLDGVGSAEGLSDWLSGQDREDLGLPKAEAHFLYVDEFGALATIGGWASSTLYYHLCRLFECPERYSIKFRKAPVNLERPTLSILGCTTPAWYWRSVREVDLMGGIGNRFLYFSGPQKPFIARPPKPDAAKLAEVQAALDRLRNVPPQEVFFTPEAEIVWDQFFAKWQESRPQEELAAAITKRVDLYMLKLAMKYAALEGTLPRLTKEQVIAAVGSGITVASAPFACSTTVRRIPSKVVANERSLASSLRRSGYHVAFSNGTAPVSTAPSFGGRWSPWYGQGVLLRSREKGETKCCITWLEQRKNVTPKNDTPSDTYLRVNTKKLDKLSLSLP